MKKKSVILDKEQIEAVGEPSGSDLNLDSNATHDGGKCRVTFLADQSFRGVHRKEGEIVELPEKDAQAYSKRTTIKVERLEK